MTVRTTEPVTASSRDARIDFWFRIGMSWRIVYGCGRIALAIVLLSHIGTPFTDLFKSLMRHEIVEDPNDILVRIAEAGLAHGSFMVTRFLAAYLGFWGVIDIGLSTALLKNLRWAFPVSLTLIGLFLVYEVQRFTHTHSIVLAGGAPGRRRPALAHPRGREEAMAFRTA